MRAPKTTISATKRAKTCSYVVSWVMNMVCIEGHAYEGVVESHFGLCFQEIEVQKTGMLRDKEKMKVLS